MDPVTQGILGATAAQVSLNQRKHRQQIIWISCLGFLSGLAADLDVFINSKTDPLLFLQYHRHFTHSLIFIPFGGLLTAVAFYLLLGKRCALTFREAWGYCTAAYATHALLDACTSYGTQLLWPFSSVRIAWNNMSIIDPLYTLPIVILVLIAAGKKQKKWAFCAAFWALFYPQLGVMQRERAEALAEQLAESRGHLNIQALSVKPSLGNLILWKSIYEHDNYFYVDAVWVGLKSKIYTGDRVQKLAPFEQLQQHFAWLNIDSQQARDVERFRWFSQGYVAQDPHRPEQIMDVRYSAVPNQINPLWSIELSPSAASHEHAEYIMDAERRQNAWPEFKALLLGQ